MHLIISWMLAVTAEIPTEALGKLFDILLWTFNARYLGPFLFIEIPMHNNMWGSFGV